MDLSIKIIQTNNAFLQIREDWQVLEQNIQHTNLTSCYDWLFTWWSVFEKVDNNEIGFNKKLFIICLYRDNALIAIAPFVKVIRKIAGIKISFLEFLGQQWSAIYLDFIAKDLLLIERNFIFQCLYKNLKFNVLFLKYIPQNTSFFSLHELNIYYACPHININNFSSFEDYKNKFYSRNLKQNIRTASNRIENNKDILKKSIETINDDNFKDIVAISKSKLLDDKNWLYGDKNKMNFYKTIYSKISSNVSLLKINDKNVAYRTNMIFNNYKFCIDASYDRAYKKYELGSLSVDLNINDSFEKKLTVECMGPGIDLYKFKFTKELTYIYIYLKRGNSFLSNFFYIILKILVKRKGKLFEKDLSKNKIN